MTAEVTAAGDRRLGIPALVLAADHRARGVMTIERYVDYLRALREALPHSDGILATAQPLGDLAGTQEPGADSLRKQRFRNLAGQWREVADVHHHNGSEAVGVQGGGRQVACGEFARFESRAGGHSGVEHQFLVAENQAVLVVQKQGQTHAAGVHEGTVAAAQVHQRVVAAILALDEGVQAGNRAAVQEDGAAVAAPDRPRLALG